MLEGSEWYKNALTYKVTKYPSKVSLTPEEVDGEIRAAMDKWEKVSNLKLHKNDSGNVDIDISFVKWNHGDDDPFDGPGGTFAHAFFPSFHYLGGDVHMDDTEDWTLNTTKGVNLLFTFLHELGHSLGLNHSDVPGSIMAPVYPNFDPELGVELHLDDIAGIRALYGKKELGSEHISETTTNTTTLCSDPSIDLIVGSWDGASFVFKGSFYWKLKKAPEIGIASGYPRKIRSDWKGLPDDLDAGFTFNGSTFFFKENEYWKFLHDPAKKQHPKYNAAPEYPKNITVGFPGIPDSLDAAFVWGGNKKFYFFKGSQYWLFDPTSGVTITEGYPRNISRWGVPNNIEGAFLDSSGHTYFFKDGLYWRFDDELMVVDKDYPRDTAEWWFGCKNDKPAGIVDIFSLW